MKKLLMLVSLLFIILAISLAGITAEEESSYVGSDTCATCHEEIYKNYAQSLHGIKADSRTPEAMQGCETCHGPGGAHADAGGGKGIGGLIALGKSAPTPAEKKIEICMQCHDKGKVVLWDGSAHDSRDLVCGDCHSIHSGNPKNLSERYETKVCVQCHKKVLAELKRQSHHPIREGKITCSNCHNPHGSVTDGLIAANYVNEKCWGCHAEIRGPYFWEHAPVTEDCMTCHTPHGSVHSKLLAGKLPYICQRCHSNSRHPGTLYALSTDEAGQSVYNVNINRLFYRSCLNCHVTIHGSNHPSGKSLLR